MKRIAAVAAFGLSIASMGNVHSQSMRAFTHDEMGKVLDKMG